MRRKAVGEPFALAIVHLEVDGVLDFVQRLQFFQRVHELFLGPGIIDAGGDAYPGFIQVCFVAPDRQTRVKGAQAVQVAAVGALVDDRGQEIVLQVSRHVLVERV